MLPKSLGTWLAVGFCAVLVGIFCAGAVAIYLVTIYGRDLPDVQQLANYQPPVMTRVYAGDGRLLQQYAAEARVFVPIAAIPKRVTEAFISAEDQNFYQHHGIDFVGILRSVFTDVGERLAGKERRMKGASTITQQVVQNFLLGKEYKFSRKIREAILSVRIEQAFNKDHILELYLNEIDLGNHSFGVAAAAMNYFNKPLDDLTLSEVAFLAALPKGPANYNPERHPDAARDRRDYVIGRMLDDGYITAADADAARHEQIVVRKRNDTEMVNGGEYFAEEVRRTLSAKYGDDALYEGGLAVRTSLDPFLQEIADRVMREGLIRYDRRHGWRGPVTHIDGAAGVAGLKAIAAPPGMPESWQLALVDSVAPESARILLGSGKSATIPLPELTWARQWLPDQLRGNAITKASQVLHEGDVIMVARDKRPGADDPPETRLAPGLLPDGIYGLRQLPQADGAMVVMDPHTGRVLALTGGFSIARSQFDRAVQAMRQPGSSFKPFVYLTGMENGFTPSTLVLDAPIVIDLGPGQPKWKPHNFEEGEDLGLAPLRVGLEKSHNLMTVRLAQAIGMDKIGDTAEKFGIVDKFDQLWANVLGAEVTTPLRLTTAYSELVNGGRRITPTMIDRVQDRTGKTIYRYDTRPCPDCTGVTWNGQAPPELPDTREQIADPASVYQIVHMLEGVVERGTGHVVSEVGKPLAGKTGTSNEIKDTWFEGFSPDLAAGVFVGFDDPPRTLGPKEQGATVAAPIFRDFMIEALKDKPATPFRVPEGISFVRVNHDTGKPAAPGDKTVILEAFKTGSSPFSQATIMGQSDGSADATEVNTPAQPSAGGLY